MLPVPVCWRGGRYVLPVPVCWWAGRSVTCACMLVGW